LYKNNYQKFIDYNIKDVELVDKLENKLGLLELVYAIAYDGKVNYVDAYTSVRMWDIIIHNHLWRKKIVIPQLDVRDKERRVDGAYVKDPQTGMHKWIVSFDLNSLYPHLIMQYNIGPDTFHETKLPVSVQEIIDGQLDNHRHYLKNIIYLVLVLVQCIQKIKEVSWLLLWIRCILTELYSRTR